MVWWCAGEWVLRPADFARIGQGDGLSTYVRSKIDVGRGRCVECPSPNKTCTVVGYHARIRAEGNTTTDDGEGPGGSSRVEYEGRVRPK